MREHAFQNSASFFGFKVARAGPDGCWRSAFHDGFECCECIFVCNDDLLVSSNEPMHWIKELGSVPDPEEGSIGPPDAQLGAQIGKTQLSSGLCSIFVLASRHIHR